MSTMYILNSAVLTSHGTFHYTPLTLEDAKFLLQNRLHESAIGYEETAQLLSTLTGVTIGYNRQQITMQEDDTAIVCRLTFRPDPAQKGEYTPEFIAAHCELGFLHCVQQPNEVVQLALRIAMLKRNESHVQPLTTLLARYGEELAELEKAENIWDELPDVFYYATVAYEVYGWFPVIADMYAIASQFGVSRFHMEKACLAKYRRRAAGNPKDIEAERAAIMAAIAE